ncbi:RNA-binding protein, partial [Klebsiella pneumoniae]
IIRGFISVKCGYPKAGDMSRIEIRPWRGFSRSVITHPHFGDCPVEVFAIHVN